MRIVAAFAIAAIAIAIAGPAVEAQAPPTYVVGEGPYEVKDVENQQQVDIVVTNLTDDELIVSISDAGASGCSSNESVKVAPRTAQSVELTFEAACDVGDEGVAVQLVGTVEGERQVIDLELERSTDPPAPDYRALWSYLLAGITACFIAFVINARSEVSLADPLPSIDSDWSFNDSWATNLGLAATVATGVFGATDVLETVLGDAVPDLPVVVVAGALTAALIGSGPLVLAIFRRRDAEAHSAGGLLAATTVVLSGNLGLVLTLWVVFQDHATLGQPVTFAAIVAALLLIAYTWRTVPRTIEDGAEPVPPPEPESATVVANAVAAAAATIAAAIQGPVGATIAPSVTAPSTQAAQAVAPAAPTGRRRHLTAMP